MAQATTHLDFAEMVTHAEGRALGQPSQAHMSVCSACSSVSAELSGMLSDLGAEPFPELAAPGLQRLFDLFEEPAPRPASMLERLARLVPGTANWQPALAAAGLRGTASAPDRLLYEEGDVTVDLELEMEPGGFRVTGLVILAPGGRQALLAWARQDGRDIACVPVAEHGRFRFDGLPGPPTDLLLEFEDRLTRVPVTPESP